MSDGGPGRTAAEVLDTLTQARSALDACAWDRRLRALGPDQMRAVLLADARASAALDGADVPPGALTGGTHLGPVERLAARVLALHAEIPAAAGLVDRAPAQVLARFAALMGTGVLPPDEVGRPRTGPPDDPLHLRLAPAAAAVPAALAALLQAGRTTEAPALLVAGLIHAHLLILAPFGTGNGPIARAFATTLLRARGVDAAGQVPVSAGLLALGRPTYVAALRSFAAAGSPVAELGPAALERPGVRAALGTWGEALRRAAAIAGSLT